ncbi:MAG: UDP-N-acetylmuramate dehydrogenase [Acidimicrobiales bacterium]
MVTPGAALHAVADALGDRATLRKPLGPLTTYGVGGPAALYVEIDGPADLDLVRRALREAGAGIPIFVIGRGSNLLVSDAGFDGIVLHLGPGFAGLELPAPSTGRGQRAAVVRAGAALALPVLARRVADAGWSGLSWAVGVPGSVGGAVRMNAGGHGSDMASCLVRYAWVDLLADAGGTDDVDRLAYGYRSSSVKATELVVEAELEVTPGAVEAEQEAVAAIVRWRREHQPGGSNAGSVFTNPEDDSAGRLIEAAGLKGYRMGTARVSEKHANFIQADRGGRADDVHALMEHVRGVVAERCGVPLRTEVRLLGFDAGKTGPVSGTDDRRDDGPAGAGERE